MPDPAEERRHPAYEPEPPDLDRPASVLPTQQQLEEESPVGRHHADDGGGGPRHDPYAALRLRDYRLYSLGWFISTIGHQVQGVAVLSEVYGRTKSELALGYVGLVQALPVL